MGYDLHVTRRRQWTDDGDDIRAEEWRALVDADPQLTSQLDWSRGEIVAKNPDAALVEAMVALARRLGATVQGDDGEIYASSVAISPPPPPSVRERVRGWLGRWRAGRPDAPRDAALPFGVGARVRNTFGAEGTIIDIDRRAQHGLGAIRVRFDDGRELVYAVAASDLTPIHRAP